MGFSVFGAAIGTVLTYGFSGASKKMDYPCPFDFGRLSSFCLFDSIESGNFPVLRYFKGFILLAVWQSFRFKVESGDDNSSLDFARSFIGWGISSGLTILSMGDETAVSLGAPVQRLRLIGIITTLFAGRYQCIFGRRNFFFGPDCAPYNAQNYGRRVQQGDTCFCILWSNYHAVGRCRGKNA